MGKRRLKAMALAYALILATVLTAFLSALFVRTSHTLQLATLSEAQIQADQLAELGIDLAFLLLRDVDAEWYLGRGEPIDNNHIFFDGRFPDDEIGGRFELEFKDPGEVGADSALPDDGTYKLIVCTGYAGKSSARAVAYAKITNPLVNFLMVAQGANLGPESALDGPMFINGDARILHAGRAPSVPVGVADYWGGDVYLGGELHATGDIFVTNEDHDPAQLPAIQLEGEYDPGSLVHDDMNPGAPGPNPGDIPGSVNFTRHFFADPNADFAVRTPYMRELLDHYRAEVPAFESVTVPPEGLLVEFRGASGQVTFSKVDTTEVGRLYDRGAFLDACGAEWNASLPYSFDGNWFLIAGERMYPGLGLQRAREELAWDDPAFLNAPYPAELLSGSYDVPDGSAPTDPIVLEPDMDGDGTDETQGDYTPVHRIVRGLEAHPPITAIDDGENFTFIVLRPHSSNPMTNVTNDDPAYPGMPAMQSFPPVYVRGILNGRVVLIYDVDPSQESLDPLDLDTPDAGDSNGAGVWNGYPKVHMFVLAQHEMLNENGTTAFGDLVPGGIHYHDPRIKVSPADPGTLTDDSLLMISRGTLGAFGTHGHHYSWLYRNAPSYSQRYNYREALRNLDEQYANHYAPTDPGRQDDFRITSKTNSFLTRHAVATVYGVGVSNWTLNIYFRPTYDDPAATTLVGKTHPNYGHSWDDFHWNDIPGPDPPTHDPAKAPMIGTLMRESRCNEAWKWRTRGSLHSLAAMVGMAGEARFDYTFQELTDEDIKEHLHLPLSPVLIHRMTRR